MKKYTKEQIKRKYKGKYIEVTKEFNYEKKQWEYEIIKTSKNIKENMTLGEDLGTEIEYCR